MTDSEQGEARLALELEAARAEIAALQRDAGECATRRLQLEQLLAVSEERYRGLTEDLQVGVLIQGKNAEILWSNQRALELLGLDEDQLLGRSSLDPTWNVIHEDGSPFPGPTHPVPRSIATGRPVRNVVMGVFRPLLRDRAWLLVNADPKTSPDGSVRQVVCTFIDVSPRKRAEDSLARQASFFEQMFVQSCVSTQLLDPEGWCERINPKLGEIFGVKPEDIEGKLYNIFQDEAVRRAGVVPHLEKVFKEHETAEWEAFFDLAIASESTNVAVLDKKRVWYWCRAYPILDPNGRLEHVVIQHTDISERKLADEAVRKFSRAMEQSPTSVVITDRAGTIEYVNPHFERTTGYPQAEAVGKNSRILKSGLTPQETYVELWRTISTGGEWRGELCNRRKNGELFWESAAISGLEDEDGAVGHYIAVKEEITERRRVQEALRESESLLREAQLVAHLGCYVLNVSTGTWRSSDALDGIFGIDRDYARTVAGWIDLIHPDDRAMMAHHFGTEVLGQGCRFDKEYRILRHDDHVERWVHGLGTVARDPQSGLQSMHGTIQDITARRLAESVRRDNERRMAAVFNGSPIGIVISTAAEGRVLAANPAALRLYEYSLDEVVGRTVTELGTWANPTQRHALRQQLTANGCVDHFPIVIRRRGGTTAPAEVSGQLVELDGTQCLVAMLVDTTDRTRAEEEKARLEAQLRQAQKIESVGRLAGGVAHDFNNMLGVILGSAEMALEQVDPGQPVYGDLVEIQKAATRSADLTRQLLAFARKQTVAPKVLDLNEALAGMVRMLQRLIGENIRLIVGSESGLWPIRVDPSQVDQILANLCVNARDAISGVGTLTIETRNITVDETYAGAHAEALPGEFVQLAVRDDGRGLSEDVVEHLFEPFFTTKEVGKGTGLGLATVYGIVKQNGGFIEVESVQGAGTTFAIFFPRHVASPELRRASEAPASSVVGEETILVVEDEPAILKLARRILEKLGYVVLTASTPGEGIRLARERGGAVDLLVTDVIMPEMNGRALATRLHADNPRLRHLFMSGYTADVIADEGVLDEGTEFLQKPFTQEGLAAKVREALDARPKG